MTYMKKIDIKKIIIYILVIIIICFLKKNYIYSIGNGEESFIKDILVYWKDNQVVNIIWFLPIIYEIFVISKKYFYKLIYFDVRSKNRKKYIKKVLISFMIESFCFIFLLELSQLVIINFLIPNTIRINIDGLVFILKYVIENIFLIVEIIFVALLIKKLMYSIILILILNFLILISSMNLSLISTQIYIPFVNIYFESGSSLITMLIILIGIIMIKKIYLKYDIGGME